MHDLAVRWRTLLARHTSASAAETGTQLLARWSESHRRYHDLTHLRQVLDATDVLAEYAADVDAVRLAGWYHDAVYAGQPRDDEERSAQLAEADLTALGLPAEFVAEVGRLVRLTIGHAPEIDDHNGCVLCDADLAVLALPPAEYQRNSVLVRAEYPHVSDERFRAARAAVINSLLAAPALFKTPVGYTRWESDARANLAAELATLGPG